MITREAIEAAKDKILNSCKVCGLMDATVEEHVEIVRKKVGPGRSGPKSKYISEEKRMYDLMVHRFQQVIEDEALLDGLFLMVTNHDALEWSASRLLALYKRQYKVERVFRVMKGPLAVSPMLLEKPHRICSMIFIITLTLQLYTLIQRQAAQELLRRGSPLDGDKLLAAFDNIHLISGNGISSLNITSLNSVQLEIVHLLGVPVNKYSLKASNIKS